MTTPDPPELGAASQPYTISLAVRWGDLDGNGHVANSKYLDYATQARFDIGGWLSLTERHFIQPPSELAEIILSMPRTDNFQWLD